MNIRVIIICLFSALLGGFVGHQKWKSHSKISWIDLTGKELDAVVRTTCDTLFPDSITQSWPRDYYLNVPKLISFPFPTSWPPTSTTGIWIAFAGTHEAGLTEAFKIACKSNSSPHCDSSEASPEMDFLFYPDGKRPMVYDDPAPKPLNVFPTILFQIIPNLVSEYHVRIDTVRLPISDWMIESDTLINHPGQRDLFNAIKERRLPTTAEKARIKEYYAVDLFREDFKNFKTLQPGQKEFIEWLISD